MAETGTGWMRKRNVFHVVYTISEVKGHGVGFRGKTENDTGVSVMIVTKATGILDNYGILDIASAAIQEH